MKTTTELTMTEVAQAITYYAHAEWMLPTWDGIRTVDVQFLLHPEVEKLVGCRITIVDNHENPTPPQQQGAAPDQERVVEPQAETVR